MKHWSFDVEGAKAEVTNHLSMLKTKLDNSCLILTGPKILSTLYFDISSRGPLPSELVLDFYFFSFWRICIFWDVVFRVTPFLDSSSYLLFVLCTPTLTTVVTASKKARTVTKLFTNKRYQVQLTNTNMSFASALTSQLSFSSSPSRPVYVISFMLSISLPLRKFN